MRYKITILPDGVSPFQFVWCALFWGTFDDVELSPDKKCLGLKLAENIKTVQKNALKDPDDKAKDPGRGGNGQNKKSNK